jgi:hypothetical protein
MIVLSQRSTRKQKFNGFVGLGRKWLLAGVAPMSQQTDGFLNDRARLFAGCHSEARESLMWHRLSACVGRARAEKANDSVATHTG